MPLRALAPLLGALLALLSTSAAAFDIGALAVKSRSGENFRAEMLITFLPGESASQLIVDKAAQEIYPARGQSYAPFLDSLVVEQESVSERQLRVTLSGSPLAAGSVVLILTVEWPRGRQEQQFILEQPAIKTIQVGADQTLDTIAKRLSKGTSVSYLEMMYALYLKNPDAFYRNNMNNLKAGAKLLAPEPAELEGLDKATVYKAIRDQYEAWKGQHGGKATTEAGELLSAISDDELSKPLDLDSDPDALQKRLRALAQHNTGLVQNNQQMQSRVDQLEARVAAMTQRLLPEQPVETAPLSPPQQKAGPGPQPVAMGEVIVQPEAVNPEAANKAEPLKPEPVPVAEIRPLGQTLSLSSDGLAVALLSAVAAMAFIWFGNPAGRRA